MDTKRKSPDTKKDSSNEEFTDHLLAFIRHNGMYVKTFEEAVGFSNGTISNLVKRNGGLNSSSISKILRRFPELNANWLLTGKGNMLLSSGEKARITLYAAEDDAGYGKEEK